MQEIKPTWQDTEIVNNPAEKNIDLEAAVDDSACNEQSLDESFEVLLREKLEEVIQSNLDLNVSQELETSIVSVKMDDHIPSKYEESEDSL